jgi:hypothetical protein
MVYGVLSPYLQVQGGIKTTYQEVPAILFPFPHLAECVTPLPSVKLFFFTPIHVICLYSSIWSTWTKIF